MQPFAHGRITVEGGARQAANNGVFTFVDGAGTYDTTTHGTATAFKGGVHFEAHEGVLDIRVSDVKLSTKGSAEPTGEITADVVTKEKDGTFSTRSDIPFAAPRHDRCPARAGRRRRHGLQGHPGEADEGGRRGLRGLSTRRATRSTRPPSR